MRASELRPNPRNWRTHPDEQKDALRGVLSEVGIAGVLLAYETSDGLTLLDGHARAEISPDTLWTVAVLDIDQREADYLLATIDPLVGLADADTQALEALLRDVETGNDAIRRMFDDMLAGVDSEDTEWEEEKKAKPMKSVSLSIAFPARVWLVAETEIREKAQTLAAEYGGEVAE